MDVPDYLTGWAGGLAKPLPSVVWLPTGSVNIKATVTQRRSSVAAGAAEGCEGNPKRVSALGGQLQRLVIRLARTGYRHTHRSLEPALLRAA